MATGATIGYGSLLQRGDELSPQTFTTIAEVKSIGEFGSERELLDVANFDSENGFREYILGLKDGVELTGTANFLPNNATQNSTTGIIDGHNDGDAKDFRLKLRDPNTFSAVGTFNFSGLIRSWRVPIDVATVKELNFSIKITGPITYQAGI